MITEKGFNEARVDSGLKKIVKSQSQGTQSRLDTFFAAHKVVSSKVAEDETSSKAKPKIMPKKAPSSRKK